MRLLQCEHLTEIDSANQLSILFEKLGYNSDCRELQTEALGLTENNQESIYRSFLIADYQNSQIQVLFFELKYNSNTGIKNKLKAIARNLSNKPTNFFLLATMDYEQLFIVTTLKKLNENYNLEIVSKIATVNLLHPSISDVNILEKLAPQSLNSDYLYQQYHQLLTFASGKRKEQQTTLNTVDSYLKTIGKIPLLTKEQEILLARKVQRFEQIKKLDQELTKQELAVKLNLTVKRLEDELYFGKLAKDKLITANLRLVVSIAKRYLNRGLDFLDLIQEGNLGLIRATEKFDPTKGYKLSTYATWWIFQSIARAIADQSRLIRLPVHLYETISRIKKTTKLLSQELGRKPTEEEITTNMEMTIEKLRFIAKSAQFPISLETPIGKEEYSCLGDFIEDRDKSPEEKVELTFLRDDLENVLDTLSPRERDVLRLRYGLDDGQRKTLEEIGQILNVTRERIRQIEAKALRKLRQPNRNSTLKNYTSLCLITPYGQK